MGKTLTLKPDLSTVPQPIESIRWKYDSDLVLDGTPDSVTYFGSFRNRTTLNTQTLQLDIKRLILADSGLFSVETNAGPIGTYDVTVISKCVGVLQFVCVCMSVGWWVGSVYWSEKTRKSLEKNRTLLSSLGHQRQDLISVLVFFSPDQSPLQSPV